MGKMKRRDLLIACAAAFAGLTPAVRPKARGTGKRTKNNRIALVHVTDLYHPPQDPDDHIDLATVAALNEYGLKGVILDTTRKFLLASPAGFDIQRDPGPHPRRTAEHVVHRFTGDGGRPCSRKDLTGVAVRPVIFCRGGKGLELAS